MPGERPHPRRHRDGHSYGKAEPRCGPLTEPWREHTVYCFGIDLFHAGYYWEAHEQWEAVWNASPEPLSSLAQGLIKLAAAGVKARQGQARGQAHHARAAAELLRGVGPGVIAGLDTEPAAALAERLADSWDDDARLPLLLE